MMKLTKEESVFVEQLHDVRRRLMALTVEEDTHVDRLLSILRGHKAKAARTDDSRFEIEYFIADGREGIIILSKP